MSKISFMFLLCSFIIFLLHLHSIFKHLADALSKVIYRLGTKQVKHCSQGYI